MARRTKKGIPLFYNRITLFLLIFLVVFMGITVFDLLGKERDAANRRAEALREYDEVQNRERILENDLSILKTSRGQEALVRNTFDVAREGEEVIVVLDALPATTTEESSRGGILSWFLSLFE